MHLARPRLLPAAIAAMAALLLLKTVLLAEAAAAAEEGTQTAKAEQPASAPQLAGSTAPPAGAGAGAGAGAATAPEPAAPDVIKPPDQPTISDSERAVLLDLRQRRETLEAKSRALDLRAAELAAADKRLNDRVQQLSALQTRLESLEADREKHQSENWAGLVKIYEAMKPRDAAVIFDALDMQVLLQVLDRMQERRVAPVLAAMQPDRARLATQLLAEMRTRATTPPPSDSKG
jgi:flagellar motility protein MotE (MotC chaperone)